MSRSLSEVTRAQSVLDTAEEDFLFACCGFAERDDVDFMLGLCVNEGNGDSCEKPKRDEALLTVAEAVVLVRERRPFEDARGIDEIEPVILNRFC
jgi:hypothetical protein